METVLPKKECDATISEDEPKPVANFNQRPTLGLTGFKKIGEKVKVGNRFIIGKKDRPLVQKDRQGAQTQADFQMLHVIGNEEYYNIVSVSYTHLDVYKRQIVSSSSDGIPRVFTFDAAAVKEGASISDLFARDEVEEDFNAIVDQDDDRVEAFVSQELVGQLVDSYFFKSFIFAVIVVNAILIGLQTNEELSRDYANVFSVFDNIVLTIFVCELALKWYNGFFIYWRVGWNVLDFFIILTLLLGPTLTFLGSSRILRILRVLRAFRSLRSISALAGISVVVQTIFQSVPDMTNIALLLVIIMSVLSVAGVSLFGRDVPKHFGDMTSAMFSLFICVTQDGWRGVFKDFEEKGLFVTGALYFIVCIIVGAFVFANLVVAVVVTNLDKAMRDVKEETKKREDTLSAKPVNHEDDHLHVEQSVPIISVDSVCEEAHLNLQKPLYFGDLRHLTPKKLQNYFLIIAAVEENLVEYKKIRKEIDEIFSLVWNLNLEERDDNDSGTEEDQPPTYPFSAVNLDHIGRKGDILSNLIELEKRQVISSKHGSFSDMVKEAAFAMDIHKTYATGIRRLSVGKTRYKDNEKKVSTTKLQNT
ncbi:cation channel sperm-associated protein 4-like [Anneissia japonica]|uniref:cation channel sperm-associated protein 4-like n=1 Tax=Anneissia japonica TaxID=1529436 RepID=UPI0014258309|nr:cation channel sperm-associated protein 4-like [Anneissia japonica]